MQQAACDFIKAAVAAAATGPCGTSWLSTLLNNCHNCYCMSREGNGIFPCERGWHQCPRWNHPQSPPHSETWGCAVGLLPQPQLKLRFVEHVGRCLLQGGLVPWGCPHRGLPRFAVPEEGGCGVGVSIHRNA